MKTPRMSDAEAFSLSQFPVHLGLGATVLRQPRFSGVEWYAAYGERTQTDGAEGRLVSMHTFTAPWDTWEMHPRGEELVLCVAGNLTLLQERDGGVHAIRLGPGDAAVNPAGVWHTADAEGACTAVFITAGLGTENRPR